jgi:uncharacterized protein (DUF2267 family)
MQFHQFIGQVQSRARLSEEGEALKVTRVTLETLAECLTGEEPRHLADQLPEEIGRFLLSNSGQDRMSLQEFFNRISERTGANPPDAAFHARAVVDVLQDAVSKGEIDDVRAQLPEDLQMIFDAGSTGKLND